MDGVSIKASGGPTRPPVEPFIGRAWERAEIASAIESARAGHGELVLISGEPGIGKTRLVRETLADAAGCRTVWATCSEGDVPPFWPWMQVVRALYSEAAEYSSIDRRGLVLLVPEVGTEQTSPEAQDPVAARARLFGSILGLFSAASATRPVAVVLDDLQWADEASLLLLQHVAARVPSMAVTLVGIYRDADVRLDKERWLMLDALGRLGRALQVTGLSREELGRFVVETGHRDVSAQWLDAFARRTSGNPFFAKEVLRLLTARGASPGDPLRSVPPSVVGVVAHRVAHLPQPVSEILEVAAVIGELFSVQDIAATGRQVVDVLDALDVAGGARFIDQSDELFRFTHALVREALYENLGPAQRGRLHLQVAEGLEQAGASPAVLAHHFLQAAPVAGVDRVLHHVLSAGETALARLSHEDALGWFQRALPLIREDDEGSRRRVLLGRAEARRRAGMLSAAKADLDEVLASARRSHDTTAFARACLGVHNLGFRSGRAHREPVELLEEADRLLRSSGEAQLRAQVKAALSRELWDHAHDRADEANAVADDALKLAEEVGSPTTMIKALEARYTVAWAPGRAAERTQLARQMAGVARAGGDDEYDAISQLLLAAALIELGDEHGLDTLFGFLEMARRLRLPRMDYLALIRRAALAVMRGETEEARRLIEEVRVLGAELGEPDAPNVLGNLMWGLARCEGDAGSLVDVELPVAGPGHKQIFGLVWRAVVLLDAGRDEEARQAFRQVAAMPLTEIRRDWIFLCDVADLAAAALRFGDLELAARCRAALAPYSGQTCVAAAFGAWGGAVDHHLGALSLALDDAAAAVPLLEAALDLHQRFGASPWVAWTTALLNQAREAVATGAPSRAAIVHEGKVWRLHWQGRDTHVPDSKGIRDLALLLARPGEEMSAVDLYAWHTGGGRGSLDAGQAAVDDLARAAYRRRLRELDAEIDDATTAHDPARTERAILEREALIEELRRNFDAKGRPRRLGDVGERARKAVSARLRDAIAGIAAVDPELGGHLRVSLRTGTFCAYAPTEPVVWDVVSH